MANGFRDILLGALGEAQQRRASQQQTQSAIQQIMAKAQIQQQIQAQNPQAQFQKQLIQRFFPGIVGGQQVQQRQPGQIQPTVAGQQGQPGQQPQRIPGQELRPSLSIGPTGAATIKFPGARSAFEKQREARLEEEAQRRDLRNDFSSLVNVGGAVDDKQIERFNKQLGFDLNPQLEEGRGEPLVNRRTGKRRWRVLSNKEWDNKVSQGKFSPTEIEHLQTHQQERRAWTNVKERLQVLGVDENALASSGDISFQAVNSPIGVLSLPARFNLVGQFSKDPRFTAIKKDIELAFQAFRKRVTGAQASDRELKLLRPLLASLKDRPKVFFATVDNQIENIEDSFRDRLDIYRRAGRNTDRFDNFLQETIQQLPKVGASQITEGTVVFNESTGQTLILRNNRWVPLSGGR